MRVLGRIFHLLHSEQDCHVSKVKLTFGQNQHHVFVGEVFTELTDLGLLFTNLRSVHSLLFG